jgi:hypothetical protein
MIYRQSGEIEIDLDLGVIYFYSAMGHTLLRIGGLKIPEQYDPQLDMIDIPEPEGVSYTARGW